MKLRPLGDRVILKYQEAKEKTQSGLILPDSAKEISFNIEARKNIGRTGSPQLIG